MKSYKLTLLILAIALFAIEANAGTMYVVSRSTNSIWHYDATTGKPLPSHQGPNWPGLFVGSGALRSPHNLVLGRDRDLYVASGDESTSFFGNGVHRFNKEDGSLVRVIGAQTAIFPQGLAFGPDKMLYVGSYKTKTIQRYNPDTGEFLGDFISLYSPATSIAFGPDGNLYVASQYMIERFNGVSGAPMGRFTSGRVIEAAYSLTFGPGRDLFVFDQYNQDIIRFDGRTGVFESVFVDGKYGFNPSGGIAFGPDGNLYTTNFIIGNTPSNQGIDRYDGKTGRFLGRFVTKLDSFTSSGIAFDPPAVPEPGCTYLIYCAAVAALAARVRSPRRF